MSVYIVYGIPQLPQDIVDKRSAPDRITVDKLQFVKKPIRRKTLENKGFF